MHGKALQSWRYWPLLLMMVALLPAWAAGEKCRPGTYSFTGRVKQGESFSKSAGGYTFRLSPAEYGWDIEVVQGKRRHLESVTQAAPGETNPIHIAGWHFRNAANTGPNAGDVAAPEQMRKFYFATRAPRCAERDPSVHSGSGRGEMEITDLGLSGLEAGRKARITWMEFAVALRLTPAACGQCGSGSGARRRRHHHR